MLKTKSSTYSIIFDKLIPIVADFLPKQSDRGASFIQQLDYWLDNKKSGYYDEEGNKWVFRTYDHWLEKFSYLTKDVFGKIVRGLETAGLIISKRFEEISWISKPTGFTPYNRTKFYRIDYGFLNGLLEERSPEELQEESPEEPETTQNPNPTPDRIKDEEIPSSSIYKELPKITNKRNAVEEDGDSEEEENTVTPSLSFTEIEKPVLRQNPSSSRKGFSFAAASVHKKTESVCPTTEQNKYLEQVEDMLGRVNKSLERYLLSVELPDLKRGLAVLKQAVNKGSVSNPAGFLRRAIADKYQPTEKQNKPQFPQEFLDWYDSVESMAGFDKVPVGMLTKKGVEPLIRLSAPLVKPMGNAPYSSVNWIEAREIISKELNRF